MCGTSIMLRLLIEVTLHALHYYNYIIVFVTRKNVRDQNLNHIMELQNTPQIQKHTSYLAFIFYGSMDLLLGNRSHDKRLIASTHASVDFLHTFGDFLKTFLTFLYLILILFTALNYCPVRRTFISQLKSAHQ